MVLNGASSLYDKDLLKQNEDGSWTGINSVKEQQVILQQRQADAQRTQQLEQIVNLNAPPQIDADRQKLSQQLEEHEPVENPPI